MIVRGFSFGFIHEKVSYFPDDCPSFISFGCACLVVLAFSLQLYSYMYHKKKFLKKKVVSLMYKCCAFQDACKFVLNTFHCNKLIS